MKDKLFTPRLSHRLCDIVSSMRPRTFMAVGILLLAVCGLFASAQAGGVLDHAKPSQAASDPRSFDATQYGERVTLGPAAKLLDHLNLVLCDCKLGGFATCLCADITPGGRLTAANAGHPPPYCNGNELSQEPALPLGIALQTEYAEMALQLEAGARLTMLSDGVVEATNPATKELFGFERTQQISREPAGKIAAVALQFGQEDDITVLTLARTV